MFLPDNDKVKKGATTTDSCAPRTSARGVHYKRFEQVVTHLLAHDLKPSFVEIPPRPHADWPWNELPPSLRDTITGKRAERKQQQLQSIMQCFVAMLPSTSKSYKIVDFGGGTGHLALPLALLLPNCQVTVVDLKSASLRLVHEKASQVMGLPVDFDNNFAYPKGVQVTQHDHVKRPCRGIPNLFTFHGSMESFEEEFDVGVSLHACGEASDIVLRVCGSAKALIVAPCCVGKLNPGRKDPYIYHATAYNAPTIQYPQSTQFCQYINSQEDWNHLAKAADYSDWDEMRSARNATRRTAKALLELDRMLYLQESFGFCTALTRMDPWEASPKHDVILAWKSDEWSPFVTKGAIFDDACNADIRLAHEFLLHSDEFVEDSSEWTLEEVESIRTALQDFVESELVSYTFSTRMGGRKRKLIHCLAEQLGLLHWGLGKQDGSKTVVVAKH